jgi:hypothetical protein
MRHHDGIDLLQQASRDEKTDLSTPRRMGHFFISVDYRRSVSAEIYEAEIQYYLHELRSQPAKPEETSWRPVIGSG